MRVHDDFGIAVIGQVAADASDGDATQHHDDGVVVWGEELHQHVGSGLWEEDRQLKGDSGAHPHLRDVLRAARLNQGEGHVGRQCDGRLKTGTMLSMLTNGMRWILWILRFKYLRGYREHVLGVFKVKKKKKKKKKKKTLDEFPGCALKDFNVDSSTGQLSR